MSWKCVPPDYRGRASTNLQAARQRERVFLKADENAPGGVTADAAIGDFHAGKTGAEKILPTLRDGVAEENEGVLVAAGVRGEAPAALPPGLAEPVGAADRAGRARKAVIGRGQLESRIRLGREGGRGRPGGPGGGTTGTFCSSAPNL